MKRKFEVGDIVECKKSGIEFMIKSISSQDSRSLYHCENKGGALVHYYSSDLNLVHKWTEAFDLYRLNH